jgi:hypothetical protein
MASRELERIRNAILDYRYLLTEHAYEEMDDDHLDALDMEAAVLSGELDGYWPPIPAEPVML